MNQLRAANKKFQNGATLTENELNLLLTFYEDLGQRIDTLNVQEYRLMQRDVWTKLDTLRSYRQARDEFKKNS